MAWAIQFAIIPEETGPKPRSRSTHRTASRTRSRSLRLFNPRASLERSLCSGSDDIVFGGECCCGIRLKAQRAHSGWAFPAERHSLLAWQAAKHESTSDHDTFTCVLRGV